MYDLIVYRRHTETEYRFRVVEAGDFESGWPEFRSDGLQPALAGEGAYSVSMQATGLWPVATLTDTTDVGHNAQSKGYVLECGKMLPIALAKCMLRTNRNPNIW